MSYVFISHVEEDQDIAYHIAVGLEQAGFKAWYYERDSIPGPSYLTQILDAIQESAAIIVIISKDSIGSWQVDKEVIQVHESGKPFIPLLKGITHAEFRHRKPDWAMAMGAATSTPIPPEGVAGILPRIIAGLHFVGVPVGGATDGAAPSPAAIPSTEEATPAPEPPPTAAEPAHVTEGQPVHTAEAPVPAAPRPAPQTGIPSPAIRQTTAAPMPAYNQATRPGPPYAQPVPVVMAQPSTLASSTPPIRQSVKSWENQHSLWLLWTLFGLGGIAFLWIGYKVQERKWVIYGLLYLLPLMFLITLGWTSSTFEGICGLAFIGVWIGSLIHGLRVRRTYLWRLQQMQVPGMLPV